MCSDQTCNKIMSYISQSFCVSSLSKLNHRVCHDCVWCVTLIFIKIIASVFGTFVPLIHRLFILKDIRAEWLLPPVHISFCPVVMSDTCLHFCLGVQALKMESAHYIRKCRWMEMSCLSACLPLSPNLTPNDFHWISEEALLTWWDQCRHWASVLSGNETWLVTGLVLWLHGKIEDLPVINIFYICVQGAFISQSV